MEATKPKRILIFGWAESVHVQRWARGMKGRGFELKVISLGGTPIEGIPTTILPGSGALGYLKNLSAALSAARAFDPDLVHAHYATGFGLWGMRLGRRPYVVSVWGSDIIDLPKSWLGKMMVQRILKSADWITATSQLLYDTTVALLPDAAPRTTVIPFGVDVPGTLAPLPDLPLKLCFIKAHRPKYGPDLLLRALAKVATRWPGITLTMAGTGKMTPKLKQLTKDLGLQSQVEFVGQVDNEDIAPLLNRHHVMVMPSIEVSESFGVAAVEAAACGRAVIASRIGGIPEVVRHSETGLLTAPGDVDQLAEAIEQLAENKGQCESMGRAGRQYVIEQYTWPGSLDSMSALYERLTSDQA